MKTAKESLLESVRKYIKRESIKIINKDTWDKGLPKYYAKNGWIVEIL